MTAKLRLLDLFSGIGGFSLGLERTGGFETVAFCEIEPFCRAVLRKHWPDVQIYEDVRELTAERLAADGIGVDVICGGFPCQDISWAGNGDGLFGERSGLFFEITRLVGELEPGLLILENVSALLARGLADVLGTLASLGYDAEWHCLPASHIGAPHQRDRVWLVAYPGSEQHQGAGDALWGPAASGLLEGAVADAHGLDWRPGEGQGGSGGYDGPEVGDRCSPLADADRKRRGEAGGGAGGRGPGWRGRSVPGEWLPEPNVGRVAHGVPARVDRLRALGNAVVPQIPEIIGRAILEALQSQRQAA